MIAWGSGLVVGPVLLGVAQAWVLRSHIQTPWYWAIATIISGWLAAGIGIFFITMARIFPAPLHYALSAASAGFIIGIAQWLALRRQVQRAYLWLGSSALALVFGASWVITLGESEHYLTSDFLSTWQWLGVGLLSGAIGGGIKGVILWRLLRHLRRL